MTRTHEEVGGLPQSKWTETTAARGVEEALEVFKGRWKLEIMFRLFGGKVLRFSDLERAAPGVSQKMLAQQLRQLEQDFGLNPSARASLHVEKPQTFDDDEDRKMFG